MNENDEDDESDNELAEDSERDEDAVASNNKSYENQPLSCFKDLYQCTPIY
jgi:hypothetical protein